MHIKPRRKGLFNVSAAKKENGMRGKDTCKTLKQIRKTIAEKNGIQLEVEECTYEGDCSGTCPKCEAELRELERALDEKEARGESVDRSADIEPPKEREKAINGADALRRTGRRDASVCGKMILSDEDEYFEPKGEGGKKPPFRDMPLRGMVLPPPDERLRMKRPPEDIHEMLEGEPAWPPENGGEDGWEDMPMGKVVPPREELAGDVERNDNMEGCIPTPKKKSLLEKLRSIFRKN